MRTTRTTRRNWSDEIERLNYSKRGFRRIRLGTAGSAQVTRCRLLAEWSGLFAETEGSTLVIALDPERLPSAR